MGRDNYDNEDKFLLSAVCEGDRRAFDCIFRRYYVDIVMFCGRFWDDVKTAKTSHKRFFSHYGRNAR